MSAAKSKVKLHFSPVTLAAGDPSVFRWKSSVHVTTSKFSLAVPAGNLRAVSPMPGEAQDNAARPPSPPQAIHTDFCTLVAGETAIVTSGKPISSV